MILAATAIFSSAFLLFVVQPMIGKAILPSYGGVPAVWSACLVFFQSALLLGYWGAHVLVTRCSPRLRVALYSAAAFFAGVSALRVSTVSFHPSSTLDLSLSVFLELATSIGCAYVVLSATAPLIQGVLGQTSKKDSVYRLYAISNIGSLGSLLAYPFLIEPGLPLTIQTAWWAYGVIIATVLIALTIALSGTRAGDSSQTEVRLDEPSPSGGTKLMWMAYSACGTILLLSGTTYLSQDVAPVPLLWVIPLALYLLTYILAFSSVPCGRGIVWLSLLGVFALIATHPSSELSLSLGQRVIVACAALFSALMSCHVELARIRPETRALSSFFFISSLGGVLGGVWVSFIAPRIYHNNSELLLGLTLCLGLGLIGAARRDLAPRWPSAHRVLVAVAVLASFLVPQGSDRISSSIASQRNFFGIVRISDLTSPPPHRLAYRRMSHGSTTHGIQLTDPDKKSTPTTYYGKQSAVGLILDQFMKGAPRRIGVVGLGAGTLATYGRSADTLTFYEINPAVVDLAVNYFSFLRDSKAPAETILGDARLTLAQEDSRTFDILVIDAFSSDSIPVHLITREALALYLKRLAPHGVVLIHISNRYLSLAPVVSVIADSLGRPAYYAMSGIDSSVMTTQALYMVIPTQDAENEVRAIIPNAPKLNPPSPGDRYLWTDAYSNIVSVMSLKLWSQK